LIGATLFCMIDLSNITYWQYHLLFQLPAFLLLLGLLRWREVKVGKAALISIGGIALIALLTTTPWDNYAVYRKIWDFDWARTTPVVANVGGVEWKLPLEEYGFFIFETVLVGLLTLLFLPHSFHKGDKGGGS